MERVGDQKRIIGFSCGNQFVITPMIAFKVLLNDNYLQKFLMI
jgi:hypothetical protein